MSNRDDVRRLANASIARGDATGWFEALYQRAGGRWDRIPWADLEPNPYLVEWLAASAVDGRGRSCLVVGCGLGDDAEALAAQGFDVVAFDISATAIDGCRARDPEERVGELPWPRMRSELKVFREAGLTEVSFEDFLDQEAPPVRRFRVLYERVA